MKIRKMLTSAGGGLTYTPKNNIERTNYNNWSKLSFADKMKRRFNIAKHLFNESSSPIVNSISAIFGEYDPENPDLNTGEAPNVGIKNSYNLKQILDNKGLINVQKAAELIKTGKNKAVQYLSSNVRKTTDTHNTLLAKRLGFKNFKPHNNAANRASTPSKLKLKVDQKATTGGSVSTHNSDPSLDLVELNLVYNPENAMFHETLHRGYVGNAPKEFYYEYGRDVFGDTNKFYDFIKDKTLKPWSEIRDLPHVDYLDKSEELAVNLLEAGKELGINPGSPYPGKTGVLELLLKLQNSNSNKQGIVQYLNLKKPKRIWRGLTGTLFGTSLVGGMTYGME